MTLQHARIPDGFEVVLKPEVERRDCGSVLVGGSPLTVLRLKPPAVAILDDQRVRVRDERSRSVAASLLRANLADPDLAVHPSPSTDVLTVVIPVHDRPAQLAACLAALRQHPRLGLRVLVVDDASRDTDAIRRVCREHGAEHLGLETNLGPAGARNAGLAHVATPYVAFVDSDVTVTTEILLSLARHFADPDVALVAPMVASKARAEQPRWFERYDEVASSLALGKVGCSVHPGAPVAWLPSACLVARTEVLTDAATNGFDENMRVGEDVDLVWRLVDAGAVVRYDPAHIAWHDTRTTVRSWLGRKLVYGTGGAALGRRHGDKCATAILRPVAAAGAAALLLRRWWSLPVAAICVLHGACKVEAALPAMPGRRTLSGRLAVRGMGWAVRQESALLLRHWWPATAAACLVSRTARRAVVSALVVDTLVARSEAPELPAPLAFTGRRLDDLAYGAGLWLGSLRHRNLEALKTRTGPSPKARPISHSPEGQRVMPRLNYITAVQVHSGLGAGRPRKLHHAKLVGANLTACGLDTKSWERLWDHFFPSGPGAQCSQCLERTGRPRSSPGAVLNSTESQQKLRDRG